MQQQPPGNGLSPWQAWSLELQTKLRTQQSQIFSLEQQLAAISAQLKQLESKPTYHIEKLEYHFDQLKVEKLEGTLNIGMTPPGVPNGDGDIEQLSVPPKPPNTYPAAPSGFIPPSEPYADVRAEVDRYLSLQGMQKLVALESEYGVELDPYHRKMVLEDIRKQMPTRIHFYMQLKPGESESGPNGHAQETQTEQQKKEVIISKTVRDADAAMQRYIQLLKNGGGS
ncbi:spore germination protein GerPC [Paenibacillus glycanilyticus]|uniref:spore germination protein GerPC n=1 Tax=Paenibacillus glycanilyticus TaxID=126569 RepID=UPI00203CB29C|nr:spore germination protein GerPC [Paenibacillus glycanilyticus]MCM3627313.1 spore germination protein GerPC [Paenibacillus glycanilyticus]